MENQLKQNLELNPDKAKNYLKLLTEASVNINNNFGSLRKDIWEYLYSKYVDKVEFRDFLIAIRKFKQEGKLLCDEEGVYRMHPEVLYEVKQKTPTPVFKDKFKQEHQSTNMLNSFLKK